MDPAVDAPELRLLEVGPGHEGLLARFYEELLVPAFPPEELLPLETLAIKALAGEPTSLVVLALAKDDQIVGGIVGDYFARSRTLLLSYVVVRQGHRGSGIGRLLLSESVPHWVNRFQPLLGVGEVEDPIHFPGAGPSAVERLRLYSRFPDVWICLQDYTQPSLRTGSPRVPHMLLLTFHVDSSIQMGTASEPIIRGDALRTFLEEYYSMAEGQGVSMDPEVDRLMKAVDASGNVHLLRIG